MNRTNRLFSVAALAALMLGCDGQSSLIGLFNPTGDNESVCRTISPGNEISARIGYRGKATKLLFTFADCKVEKVGTIEIMTLVATASDDGFISGDKNAKMTLRVARENGLAMSDKYSDAPLQTGQQPEHFDVSISSETNVNAISLLTGAGGATVSEYKRAANRVTTRVAFKNVPLLNLTTNTIETICGEAYFDGSVTVIGE